MSVRAPRRWQELLVGMALAAAVAICGPDATAQKSPDTAAQKNPNAGASKNADTPKNQGPPNALQGFSQKRDEPVKIRAASLEVREKDKMATFTGDVHVVNGDTEMRCKSLLVFYEEETGGRSMKAADPGPGGSQQIKRIEAKGGVTVVQKDQHATGDSATFNMRENTVTLNGNVVVTRGQDVLRGPRLVVNLTTGVSEMKAPSGSRVDVLIVPKSTQPPEKK